MRLVTRVVPVSVAAAAVLSLAGCGGSTHADAPEATVSSTSSSTSSPTTAISSASSSSTSVTSGATSTKASAPAAPSGSQTSGASATKAAPSKNGASAPAKGNDSANGKSASKSGAGDARSKNASSKSGGQPQGKKATGIPSSSAVAISVPSIGINNHALSTGGTNAQGVLSPPSGVIQRFVGYGRVNPGQPGISVLAGHVTWNGPDVFFRLPSIAPGAKITITYGDGTARDFTVTGKASVNKQALQNDPRVWGGSASPVIALVTCDSNSGWANAQHHTNNYVVWARPSA